jgi:hypothetical protein
MRITWNENDKQFETQVAKDSWQNDKEALQAAGFRTDGPPAWIWRTNKATVLAKLKESRPASGLTITREALDAYNRLRESEQQVEELKKYAKEQKKLQKTAQERARIEADREDGEEVEPEYETSGYHSVPEYWKGKHEITRADLPADTLARFDKHESIPQRRAEALGRCRICGDATYYPEDPDLCMWCEGRGEEKFLDELF